MHGVKKYIFACVHNAGRSQMAAAWFGLLADPALAVGLSAGTAPAQCVHPEVVTVMREVGIDLAHVTPRHLTRLFRQHTGLSPKAYLKRLQAEG